MTYASIYFVEALIIILAIMTARYALGKKKPKRKEKGIKVVLKSVAERNYKLEQNLKREFLLDKKSPNLKAYNKYDDVLTSLGLKEKGVTVTGFKFGLRLLYTAVTLGTLYVLKMSILAFIVVYPIIAKLIFTLIKMRASTFKDRRQRAIMDAIDIIVSDMTAGVEVAIRNYIDVFDRSIRSEFETFLKYMSYNTPFVDAIDILNEGLGDSFTDFAEKSKIFEIEGRAGSQELFADTIERNSRKRNLKFRQDAKFSEFKLTFNISLCLVGGLFVLTLISQPFVRNFFFNTIVGKILILLNILIVTFVLSYLDNLKSE